MPTVLMMHLFVLSLENEFYENKRPHSLMCGCFLLRRSLKDPQQIIGHNDLKAAFKEAWNCRCQIISMKTLSMQPQTLSAHSEFYHSLNLEVVEGILRISSINSDHVQRYLRIFAHFSIDCL